MWLPFFRSFESLWSLLILLDSKLLQGPADPVILHLVDKSGCPLDFAVLLDHDQSVNHSWDPEAECQKEIHQGLGWLLAGQHCQRWAKNG